MALTYEELIGIQEKRKKREEQEQKATTKVSTKPYAQRLISPADDIAPVKKFTPTTTTKAKPTVTTSTKKKEDERTWFKKGSYFDDGYDFGDITKTILGTVADVGENIGAGIVGMGEKAVDALAVMGTALGNAQMAQNTNDALAFSALKNIGKDKNTKNKAAESIIKTNNYFQSQAKKGTTEFVTKDLYDEEQIAKKIISAPIKEFTGMDIESASVFGEKSDALVQSAGQLLGTAALNAVGVPWFLTTGATSFGAEAEGAFKEGATFEQGAMSAVVSAGAEILSEKLSGGIKFGGKTLDDVLLKPLTEKITNKVAKTLVNLGVDALGEGFEEVFSGVVSNLGSALYKEESIGELLASEEAFDEYLESFIGGAVLGGGSSIVRSVANRNAIELDEREQKVYDKVVEDRINKEKEDGTKITKKKEAEIRNAVLRDMLKGYIDTDTIESVLGGDTYKAYKDSVDGETALQKEFDTLNKMKQGEMTGEQLDRRSELKQQLEEIKNNSKTSEIKAKLGEDVFNLVKDSRLAESYNEASRRGQTFEADLSKYDTKQQKTIKKAIESGILNNTNRTHEFVDMVAKISADKGVLFDFVNNEKIKASGFAVEGKTVNGYKTDEGNIAINIESSKSLDSIVGHEITHILEGTELYAELQNAVKEYATNKGEYASRLQSLRKMYEGVYKGEDFDDKIRAELTADIVGEYLFTDADFVNRLSAEKPNVFKKLYDEIKYLCKVATAGSKEARELERVKRNFEKAYKESAKSGAKVEGVKLSISGINSKTADKSLLSKAEQLLDSGADSETVRQKTGWYKGYDGQWRFEIDDSQFEFYPDGKVITPEILRARELKEKFNDQALTKDEFEELRALYQKLDISDVFPGTLGRLVEHKELFEAYPQLESVRVTFDNLNEYTDALYDSRQKVIKINNALVSDNEGIKTVLIHEIQHAIQDIEGFARGSTVEYWKEQRADIVNTLGGARRNLDLWLDDIGYSDFVKKSMQEVVDKKKTIEQHWEDCKEFKQNSKYAEQIANCEREIAEYQQQYDEITNGMTASEQYLNTAGEIEARDAENRLTLNAEQRKNKRPDIDRENVVFADTKYSLSETDNTYLSAVESGDTETAQKMVDEVAKENGYTIKAYHGTGYDFTVFDESKQGSNYEDWGRLGKGFYFAPDKKEAKLWAERSRGDDTKVIGVYLKDRNLINAYDALPENLVDTIPDDWDSLTKRLASKYTYNYIEYMQEKGYDVQKIMREKGYAGVVASDTEYVMFNAEDIKSSDAVTYDDNGNVIPLSERFKTESNDIRYSLSEDSEGRKLTKKQQEYFKKVSPLLKDENGNIKRYYHGTARGDRVGTLFDPERATSGPMAFFTDNPEIAEGYSKSKADTSMAYDSDYDSYETQFRVNVNGSDMSLIDAWRYLPMSVRARIKDRAEHTHYDWEDYETLVYDENTTEANGGFSWQIREARGNVLQALNEQWLNSGTLFGEESKYIDVLKFIGVHDELKKLGYGEPYYKDPHYREEKVFEVYLNVTNPFHTADVDEEFLDDARDWVDNTDLSIYESETADSDLWDKRSLDPYEWLDRLESDIENGTTHAWTSIPDVITDFLKEYGGYDGIVDAGGKHTGYGHQVVIPFYSEQIKNIDNENPTTDAHIDLSLSEEGATPSKYGRFFAKDVLYQGKEDIAPVQQTSATEEASGTVNETDYAPMTEAEADAMWEEQKGIINTLSDADMPPEMDAPIYSADTTSLDKKTLSNIANTVKDTLYLSKAETKALQDVIQRYSTSEQQNEEDLFNEIKAQFGEKSWEEKVTEIAQVKQVLRGCRINVSPTIKRDIPDYAQFRKRNFGKILFANDGMDVDKVYMTLSGYYPSLFPDSIGNATDQLLQIAEVANMDVNKTRTDMLSDETIREATELITDVVNTYKEKEMLKATEAQGKEFLKNAKKYESEMPVFDDDFAPVKAEKEVASAPISEVHKEATPTVGNDVEEKPTRRSELHQNIVDRVKGKFEEKGFDFDEVLSSAKNLSTFATVDNIPQRVMEKALGYKQGQILADETVNKVAQNESESIKWLNSFTDRKNGLLAQISKQYNIKPGSKKSAAAQMYAEGFYVGKNNEIIEYGDKELAIDFPDVKVQESIKGLANDPRIRQIYDETLNAINESRSRNLYPEIPRLDNYFLHFRAMEDTFSRLGLPFNPNDIRAKDLPTDLNGVTADLKPGQPYFASAMHREGMRTSFDLLGGLERYLSSAKNQIYHIDDIQTLRALRNYIADTYGQAKGLDSLDNLSEEDVQERIKQVYGSHLSTFAKFLNEEANVLAGKTTLIDRGLEGIIGRRGITFLNTINGQVGSNMVGWNISSSLTNFLPVAQTLAKGSKVDFTKAFVQTVSSKIGSIFGKTDSFVENNPTIIRRKGAERFYRTPFQKIGDTGYVLMSAVDDISTELIVRTKYNELVRKGMSEQKASFEADKWVSRLMGDRSLGQQPQLYNSKMLGLITKFQLEVRNQLDSQFYDTIQEAKVSNEEIESKLLRNAKTAAKVTSTFVQLAVVQHLYGTVFESIAGYNPAFDIIDVLIKALGFDDDEEDEDTVLDNLEEGFFALLEDLPYTSTFTGGRIPISSALPVSEFIKGVDQYGNEKSRWDTLKKVAPYYVLPTGYGQIKKTANGLNMFSDEHPVAGSYTNSGNLRFPIDNTLKNRIQAGVFGQYASENARTYFDEGYAPLKEKQIQEYKEVDMPIADYWKYREGLSKFKTQDEKVAYINGLDISKEQKDVLKSYLYDVESYKKENPEKYAFLEREGIGFLGYKELDEDTQSAWSWAFKHQDEYEYYKSNGVLPGDYSTYYIPMLDFENEDNDAYSWAYDNPEKATFSKAITDNVVDYRKITKELYAIRADKDENGKAISGSAKEKKQKFIWSLDIDDGAKYILFKNEYNSCDDYNYEIIDYLNNRDDISYDEMKTILTSIGFEVDDEGNISWD